MTNLEHHRVLLLGAGASYGHGSVSALKPPLVNGFFSREITDRFGRAYQPLFRFLHRVLGLGMRELRRVNIEDLFAQVEPLSKIQLDITNPAEINDRYGYEFIAVSPFGYLKSYVSDVVREQTSWLLGQECPYHRRLLGYWLSPGDTVVSFNYDLIADRSLARLGCWDESTGYGWHNIDLFPSVVASKVYLLKPHGSLNWYPRPGFGDDAAGSRRSVLGARKVASLPEEPFAKAELTPDQARRTVEIWRKTIKRSLKADDRMTLAMVMRVRELDDTLPRLMVPTPYKPLAELGMGEFGSTWAAAKAALSLASEVLAVGCSFMDPHFNAVLANALRTSNRSIRLSVVSPSAVDAADRLTRMLPKTVTVVPLPVKFAEFLSSADFAASVSARPLVACADRVPSS